MMLYEIINEMSKSAEEGWGKSYYHVMPRIINERGLKVGAEIGVAYGGHSEAILRNTKVERLYTVDPYQPDMFGTDGYSLPDGKNFGKDEYEELYLHALHRIRRAGGIDLLRMTSAEAWSVIDCKLDFVFIDAKHTFESLNTDIFLWKQRVRKGGIIAGHDFDHPSYPGIRKAVLNHFKKVTIEDGFVWWTEK